MRETILRAARTVLLRGDITGWTMAQVAGEAGCAKGLVHYHFKTKSALLAEVAGALGDERLRRRGEALEREGTAALDALWSVLVDEVRSGAFRTWLAFLALDQSGLQAILRQDRDDPLARAAARALALETLPVQGLIPSILDGFQVALLRGTDPAALRDGFDRFWLGLLG